MVATVVKVDRECPVFKVGDRITFDYPRVVLKETDAICLRALSSMLTFAVTLPSGIGPDVQFEDDVLDLASQLEDPALRDALTNIKERQLDSTIYLRCPVPLPPLGGEGPVIFALRREEGK